MEIGGRGRGAEGKEMEKGRVGERKRGGSSPPIGVFGSGSGGGKEEGKEGSLGWGVHALFSTISTDYFYLC